MMKRTAVRRLLIHFWLLVSFLNDFVGSYKSRFSFLKNSPLVRWSEFTEIKSDGFLLNAKNEQRKTLHEGINKFSHTGMRSNELLDERVNAVDLTNGKELAPFIDLFHRFRFTEAEALKLFSNTPEIIKVNDLSTLKRKFSIIQELLPIYSNFAHVVLSAPICLTYPLEDLKELIQFYTSTLGFSQRTFSKLLVQNPMLFNPPKDENMTLWNVIFHDIYEFTDEKLTETGQEKREQILMTAEFGKTMISSNTTTTVSSPVVESTLNKSVLLSIALGVNKRELCEILQKEPG
jgi:hypothetical protein